MDIDMNDEIVTPQVRARHMAAKDPAVRAAVATFETEAASDPGGYAAWRRGCYWWPKLDKLDRAAKRAFCEAVERHGGVAPRLLGSGGYDLDQV